MNWNELFMNILFVCITCIVPILIKYIVTYLSTMIKIKAENIKDEQLRNYVLYAEEAIANAVIDVCQTYVDSLKKAGKFDKESQAIAKQLAIEKAIAMITGEAKQAIETLYGDFNVWMDTHIETAVRMNKMEVTE